jgi:uncharacterized protein with von Willebrand factor type A (vWA) domain
VGLAAEIDLARALERIDVLDRAQVRWACRSILATSPDELKTVDAVFSAFWDRHGLAGSLPWTGEGLAALSPDTGRRRTRLGGRPGGARDEAPTVVVPVGTYSPHAPGSTHPISLVRDVRLRALRHGARRFRRHYATRPGRRFVRSRHGSIELRDTVRQSLRLGGELVELRRQEPRIGRAEIVVVWDVSGSMREHESPLFALVHALESVSRGARVFAFSTHLTEITDEVRRHGYRRAAERVGRRLDRTDGGTRIGASLAELRQRFAGAVGERSTLVIVSDGWDLGEADRVALELDRLRRRAHAVVWINPYARRTGFAPRVAALRAALPLLDALIGPEDFESRSIVRPIDLTALPPV